MFIKQFYFKIKKYQLNNFIKRLFKINCKNIQKLNSSKFKIDLIHLIFFDLKINCNYYKF